MSAVGISDFREMTCVGLARPDFKGFNSETLGGKRRESQPVNEL